VDIESQWSKWQFYSSASVEQLLCGVGEELHSSYPYFSFPHFLTGMQKPQKFFQCTYHSSIIQFSALFRRILLHIFLIIL